MESLANNIARKGSIYTDLQSLDAIRKQAKYDQRSAIKAAAKEFEAFFMNMMLKSMRQASEVIGDDSMFGSSQEKMFVGMLDEQMSVELSQKGNLGIAELLTRDLVGESDTKRPNIPIDYFAAKSRVKTASKITEPNSTANSGQLNLAVMEVVTDSASEEVKVAKPFMEEKFSEFSLPTKSKKTGASEKKSLFDNAQDFISELLPAAERIAKNIGIDPKLLLAQAALETGWGKFIMHDDSGRPSFNLFGIKSGSSWSGDSVNIDSLEVENGTFVKKKDNFRMYENFEKSFEDYAAFLKNSPRYQSALELVKDSKKYVQSLQDSGYATDPEYANKILRIFEKGFSFSSIPK